MLVKKIYKYIKDIFTAPSMQDNLEAYIASRNPQTTNDVDRFEREYYLKRQTTVFEKYY